MRGNKCLKCGSFDRQIITVTKFGHGDSTHRTHVQCEDCDSKSDEFGGWGIFEVQDVWKAIADWNQKNEPK